MNADLPIDLQDALGRIEPRIDLAPPIGQAERQGRLDRARTLLERTGADALLVGAGASLSYFAGLDWAPSERLVALLLPRTGDPLLICPAFELGSLAAAGHLPMAVRAWQEDEDPAALVASCLAGGATLALDPETPLRVATALSRAGLRTLDGASVVEGCRQVKSAAEIALIADAMAMTLEVQRLTRAALRPGLTASAVRRFVDQAHRAIGAAGGASFCAVQFDQATAFPHGVPGEQTLGARALVLVDTGCLLHGYQSDITRTYAYGAPEPDHVRIWQIEHEAQAAAFDAARPGEPCGAVDEAARAVLARHGLGPDYALPGLPHRTGHGIGLSIHEAPYFVRGSRTPLQPGMCLSVEPMIVVPDRFGIRLEDHLHVTGTGAAWFTTPSGSIEDPFACG